MYKYLIIIYLLLSIFLLFNPDWNKFYDAPRYISLAYSIAQGNGYRFIFDSENKPCFYNNFIFPYLLSPLVKFFDLKFYILKGFILMLGLLCLLFFYNRTKFYFKTYEAFYLSILFLSLPIFLEFNDKILTEIPFLLLTIISFYLFEIWTQNKRKLIFIFLLLSLYLAIFTRIIGLAILFSLLLWAFIKKDKFIFSLFLIISVSVVVTFLVIQYRVQAEDKFYDVRYFLAKNPFAPQMGLITVKDLLGRTITNTIFYLSGIGKEIINYPSKPIWLSVIILGLILLGIYKKNLKNLYSFYLLIYIIYFLIWPWQDKRFIMPVSFLLLVFFYSGLKFIINSFGVSIKKSIYALILILSVYGGINKTLEKMTIEKVLPSESKEFIQLAMWAKDSLSQAAVILSAEPALVYLLSSKKGAFLIYTTNLDKITSYLKRKKVTHILADRFNLETARYIYPWIRENKNKLKILKIDGGTVLFELN